MYFLGTFVSVVGLFGEVLSAVLELQFVVLLDKLHNAVGWFLAQLAEGGGIWVLDDWLRFDVG